MKRLLRWIAKFLPVRQITGGDGALYLSWYTLLNFPGGKKHLYLHCFHRSDEDRDLHNHPWTRSHSLVLAGGYREERVKNDAETRERIRKARFFGTSKIMGRHPWMGSVLRETKVCKPGSFNTIDPDTFHRVDLLEGEAWTLFLTGTAMQRWGFLDTEKGRYFDYADYLRAKGLDVLEDDH